MKIIFCVKFFFNAGGAESQVLRLLPYFENEKIDYSVISQCNNNKNKFKNSKLGLCLYILKCLFAGLFADRNTIFYFIGAGVEKCIFYYFLKIKKIKYTVKIPTMLKGRGFDAFERALQKPFQGRIIKKFFQRANIIFTQDNLSKQVLSEKYGIDPLKVRILLNGIEPHCLRKIKKVQNIIFVGRILREKGVYEMLDFAKESINSSKDWRIIMIGDGPELENLKKMAGMQGIDNIKFYGYIEAVKKYYEEADLFLFPSYREGFPNVVLEAMSHGVPVLS